MAQNGPVFALKDDVEPHAHGLGTIGKEDFCGWVCQVGVVFGEIV